MNFKQYKLSFTLPFKNYNKLKNILQFIIFLPSLDSQSSFIRFDLIEAHIDRSCLISAIAIKHTSRLAELLSNSQNSTFSVSLASS